MRTESVGSVEPGLESLRYPGHGGDPIDALLANPRDSEERPAIVLDESHPALSPDGLDLVYQSDAESSGIFLMSREVVGGAWGRARQLTPHGAYPRWSPDGGSIVYDGGDHIGVVSREGRLEVLMSHQDTGLSGADRYSPDWSPDGRTIYFIGLDQQGSGGLQSIPAEGGSPRLRVRFDDTSRPVQFGFSLTADEVYFSIVEYEGDIYVMDVQLGEGSPRG